MKKVFAFTLVMLLSSFILSVPAFAEQIETNAEFVGRVTGRVAGQETGWQNTVFYNDTVDMPRQGVTSFVSKELEQVPINNMNAWLFTCDKFEVEAPDSNGFVGDVGLYLSYYVVFPTPLAIVPSGTWGTSSRGWYNITVNNAKNEKIVETQVVPEYYDVANTAYPNTTSKGVSYSFKMRVPEETPVLSISFDRNVYDTFFWNSNDINEGTFGPFAFVIPSAVLIADRTTAELEELENIADALMEQNEISQEHYAEVIGKLDDLYTEVGNLADLQQEAIDQFDSWNIVSSVPGSVTDKTNQAEDVLDELHQLEKPEPDQIVPELDADTTEIAQILEPYFQNTLILQILMMTLGFGFVSYVLFGKKG